MGPVVTHGKHKKNKPRQIGKNSGLIYNIKIKRIDKVCCNQVIKRQCTKQNPEEY